MARYKLVDRSPKFIPVVLDAQIQPSSFEYALNYLVDNELDLSSLHTRYNNDQTGASAYDPAVLLKIVLLAYSRGLIYSHNIGGNCKPLNTQRMQRMKRAIDSPQGVRPVDAVLLGAQHREAGNAWICPVKAKGATLQKLLQLMKAH